MNLNLIISKIIPGGFLKGSRTAVLAIAVIIGLIAQYLTGDIDLVTFLQNSWEQIALALGLVTAAVSKSSNT